MARMVKINVGTSYDTEEIVFNAETTTVEQAFRTANVATGTGVIVTHNSKRVNDLTMTLAQLGLKDGDLLTANAKTVGA